MNALAEPIERWTTSSSNVHRRIDCPGSHHAEEGLPEMTSDFAEEGTRLHAVFALGHEEFDALTPNDDITEKDLGLVRFARHLASEAFIAIVKAFNISKDEPFEQGAERELWMHRGIENIIPGHCDVWRYYPRLKLLVIIDAKFGYAEVDAAPINHQLRTYAVQGAEEWDVDGCAVAIVQPRAPLYEGAKKVTIAHYSREDIDIARKQLLEYRERWLTPNAPLSPSLSACRYCKAKAVCNAHLSRMAPASTLSKDILPSLAEMPADDLVKFWMAVKLASDKGIAGAIGEEMRKRVGAGLIPSYKLKANADRRAITDDAKAMEIAYGLIGWDGVQAAASISLTEVAAVLARKSKGTAAKMTVKEAEGVVKTSFAEVVQSNPVKPSVVEDKGAGPVLIAEE